MRLPLVLCTAALVNAVFAAALPDPLVSTGARRRGLDGFFDGLQDSATSAHDRTPVGTDATPTATPSTSGESGLKSFLGFPSSSVDATSTKSKSKDTAAAPTGTAYSIIGSLPPIHTPSASYSAVTPTTSTSSTNTESPTSTAAAASTESAASSGTSEWKIIGVAVIAFTSVAGILLLSVFFDHWWRFVRGLVCLRGKGDIDEELVPDWEKAEWDMRCGQDRQRYPSFSSLPSAAKVQPPPPAAHGPSRNSYTGGMYGQESGTSAGLAGYSQEARRNRTPSAIGLGLGRVGSTRSERSATSGRPAFAKHSKAAYEGAPQNPFDDIHSPTPEDVYGGVAR